MNTRLIATVMLSLVFAPGLALGVATAAPAAAHAQSTQSKLVYHWNFKNGMSRWTSPTTGWKVAGGLLRYDGKNNSVLKSPYELPSYLSNFAVVAVVRGIARTGTGPVYGFGVGAYYGIERIRPGTNGGYGCFYCDGPGAYLWSSFTRASTPMTAPAGFHTYRLEVRDRQYRLLLDGTVVGRATIDHAMVGPGLVIYASLYRITVKSFRVYSLQ